MMDDHATKILAEHLARGLEETKRIVQNLQTEVHAAAITQAGLKSEVQSMHSTLESLNKIIRDGNGERSVIHKLLLLENDNKKFEKYIEDQNKIKKDNETENTRGKWQMRASMLAGSVSLIVAIIAAIVALYK
jgi:hypothetical protein